MAESNPTETVRYTINRSDTPTGRVVLISPLGFGLNEASIPATVLLSPDAAGPGVEISFVTEDADGNQIVLPSDEVQAMVEAGKLQIVAEGTSSGGGADVPNTISVSGGASPLTLVLSASGTVQVALPEPTTVTSLATSDLPTGPNYSPGSIILDLPAGNSNFFGSTLFFDANFNGVLDFYDRNGDGVQQLDEPNEPSSITALDGTTQLELPFSMDLT